jgi:hypothetical protein
VAEEDPSQLEGPVQHLALRALAPEYTPGQHAIYVRHLEEAVLDAIRRSRFARPKPLTKRTAFVQALGASVGLGLLWLLGVRPGVGWPDASVDSLGFLGRAALLLALVVLARD